MKAATMNKKLFKLNNPSFILHPSTFILTFTCLVVVASVTLAQKFI